MPNYRPILGFNAWSNYLMVPFEAESDEAAIAKRPELERGAMEIMRRTAEELGTDISDFSDACIWIKRIEPDEEIHAFCLSGSPQLVAFARKVAECNESDDPDAVASKLREIVEEARKLTGSGTAGGVVLAAK